MNANGATRGDGDGRDLRILILAPTGRDARLAEQTLARAGLAIHICADLDQLRREIAAGAGAVLVAEEALPRNGSLDPDVWIGTEPAWSSLPLVVLTGRSASPHSAATLRRLEYRPKVSFLERPVAKRTLVSTLRSAIESRRRQYAMRDFLDEQARLKQALQESERRANNILESIADGFITLDRDWRITFVNPRAEEILRPVGKSRKSLLGKNFWDEFPEAVGSPFEEVYHRASREQTTADVQAFYPPLDGWFEVRAYPSGDGLYIHFVNIDERKRAEKHRELLIGELNHRVKNTLAIVQAIAQQTFKGSDRQRHLMLSFQSRLAALAAAHNLLTQSSWEQTSLEELAAQTVVTTCARNDRIKMAGPHVVLDSKTAVTFAMALHELCTNAVKYGALSTDAGYVDVNWSVSDGLESKLKLVWQERGGPPVEAPQRRGFGSRMIEQALAQEIDGDVKMEFRPEGVICTIEGVLPHSGEHPQ